MAATPSDGPTPDDPSARGGWIAQWTDLFFWPWRELPGVMRSVANRLISIAEPAAPPTDEVAARLDAVHSQLAGRLEETESHYRRELDAVRAANAALQRRVAALEAQAPEGSPREDDETDVPRRRMRSADAFREVLSRAGEMAAQRGLTKNSGSAAVVGDRGPEIQAETKTAARPSRKSPRDRDRRA
jgi:hypothetical protein